MFYISFNKVYSLFCNFITNITNLLQATIGIISCTLYFVNFFIYFFRTYGLHCSFFCFYYLFFSVISPLLSLFFTIAHNCYDQTYRNPDSCCNRDNIWCPVISAADLYKVSGKQFSLQAVHEGKSAGREDTS